MKNIIYLIFTISLLIVSNAGFAAKNNFQFQINGYHTERQAGQVLDVYIRYSIKDDVDYSSYPDYRELRKVAMRYLEPTDKLPVNTFWEIIAKEIAQDLAARYSFAGISVQLLVHANPNGTISEPGFHGPIYTIGDVTPLSEVVIPVSLGEGAK